MSRQQNRFSFVFALCAIIAASVASAEVREVSTVDGLKTAVSELGAGSVIVLKASPDPYVIDATLSLKAGVTLRGSTDNPRDTVIDGDGKVRVIGPSGSANVFTVANLTVSNGYYAASAKSEATAGVQGSQSGGANCVISNCVITCCTTSVSNTGSGAGAAHCYIYDSQICGNKMTGKGYGGGLYNCRVYDSDVFDNQTDTSGYGGGAHAGTFYRCHIFNNWCGKKGGGTYESTVLDHSVVSNNVSVTEGGGVWGGTIRDSEVVFNAVHPTSGNSDVSGGGVSSCTASNCTIRGNAVYGTAKSCSGGAAYASTLIRCVVRDNYTPNYAGAVLGGKMMDCFLTNNVSPGGSSLRGVKATRCTLYQCSVDASGTENLQNVFNSCKFLASSDRAGTCSFPPGANVYAQGGYAGPTALIYLNTTSASAGIVATNCLFAGNWANSQLLSKQVGSRAEFVNCTFSGNYTKQTIRGYKDGIDTGAGVKFVNTIFYGNYNYSGGRQDYNTDSTGITFDHCLFGCYKTVAEGCTEIASVNLKLNEDIRFDTANAADPYSLQRKSPAIGQGLYQDWMASATDLKGDPRAHEDNIVAIGCYECWIPAPGLMLLLR